MITLGAGRPPASLALLSLGTLLGWPVLAEPTSGLRLEAGQAGRALSAGQLLIGDPDWLAAHRPDIVLQVGATPTTRATQRLVADTDTLVVLDREHPNPDPAGRAERRIAVDPEFFAALAWDERDGLHPVGAEWSEAWRTADLVARRAVDRVLDASDEPFEGRVARDVGSFVPHGGTLFVGASMPIRDLDTYMAPRRPPRIWGPDDLLRVVANRGASGIDGSVASTLGAAAARIGPTYALMGELAFLADAGTLLWSASNGPDVVIVVLSNGGGQIFAELDQAGVPEFEELFLTPHPADVRAVCHAAGAGHRSVERADELVPALAAAARAGGVQVVEVQIDPDGQRARRAALRAAVAARLAR